LHVGCVSLLQNREEHCIIVNAEMNLKIQ
jgi:hypothetical protein